MNGWQPDDHHTRAFLEATADTLPAFQSATLSFVAVSHDVGEILLRAVLRLSVDSRAELLPSISVGDIRAAELRLPLTGDKIAEFLKTVCAGGSWFAGGPMLQLMPESPSRYSAYFEPLEQSRGDRPSGDLFVLSGASPGTVIGTRRSHIQKALESLAYSSIDDLLDEYGCNWRGQTDRTTLSVLFEPIAGIQSGSRIDGEQGEISVRVPANLPQDHFQISLRNLDKATDWKRQVLPGKEFQWTIQGNHRIGKCIFKVPRASVAECRAVFAGRAFDTAILADPKCLPNARRHIVELQSPELRKLSQILTKSREGDDKARNEFEASVAVLLYMLGFDVVRLGAVRKLTDGPDIYAKTQSGKLLVVECTTGQFDEQKLENLRTRHQQAQNDLLLLPPGVSPTSVTPVIVTPRNRSELGPQLAAAEKRGVLLVCGSEIAEALERTRFTPDSDAMLAYWHNQVMLRFLAAPSLD